MYCFNALFILPFFITKTFVQLVQMTFLSIRQFKISQVLRCSYLGLKDNFILYYRYIDSHISLIDVPSLVHGIWESINKFLVLGYLQLNISSEFHPPTKLYDNHIAGWANLRALCENHDLRKKYEPARFGQTSQTIEIASKYLNFWKDGNEKGVWLLDPNCAG